MRDEASIRTGILARLAAPATGASICPSEVARDLEADEADWRALMPRIRQVAAGMVEAGIVVATQGERVLPSSDVLMAGGPIRLRRGDRFPVDG